MCGLCLNNSLDWTGFPIFSARLTSPARVSERLAQFQGDSDYFKPLAASPPPPRAHSCGTEFKQIQKWHFVISSKRSPEPYTC